MGSKIYFFVVSCLNFQKTPSPPYRATPTFPKLHSKDMKLPLYGGCGFTLGVSYRTTLVFFVFLALLFKSRAGWFGLTFGGNFFYEKEGGGAGEGGGCGFHECSLDWVSFFCKFPTTFSMGSKYFFR